MIKLISTFSGITAFGGDLSFFLTVISLQGKYDLSLRNATYDIYVFDNLEVPHLKTKMKHSALLTQSKTDLYNTLSSYEWNI